MPAASDGLIHDFFADLAENPTLKRANFDARALFAAASVLHQAARETEIGENVLRNAASVGVSREEFSQLFSAEVEEPVSLGTIAAAAAALSYDVELRLVPRSSPRNVSEYLRENTNDESGEVIVSRV